MFKSVALAALSLAVLSNPFGYGYGNGDFHTVNKINNIQNRKYLQVENAVHQAIGLGNYGLKRELQNDLNGIIADGTNQLNSLALSAPGGNHLAEFQRFERQFF